MNGIWTLARASFRHRPGRFLSGAAIVALGVTLMVALQAVVLSVTAAVAPIYAGVHAGADWIVRPGRPGGLLDPHLAEELRALPGVAWAVPRGQAAVTVSAGGEVAEGTLFAVDPEGELAAGLLELVEGRLPGPDAPGAAIRADAARRLGLRLGDPIFVQLPDGRPVQWPLVGLLGLKGVGGGNGFPTVVVHLVQGPLLGLRGVQQILVGLDPDAAAGWEAAARNLLIRHQAILEEPHPPYTGQVPALVLLTLFSLLGPAVGSLLIQNAFAISLRERSQELSLWRVVGTTPRQLVAFLAAEGALLGLGGGLLGLGAGLMLARLALQYLEGLASISAWDWVSPELTVPWHIPALSLAVGVAVTVLAALGPAWAAAGRSALAARREALAPDPPVSRIATGLGGGVAVLGLALSPVAAGTPQALWLAALHFAGLMAVLPALIRGVAARFPVLPGPLGGAMTLGARRMAENWKRAAGGARALMLATGLLVGFGAITRATWDATRGAVAAWQADLRVQGGLTDGAQPALMAHPDVAAVTVMYRTQAVLRADDGGEVLAVLAFDPADGLPVALKAGDPEAALAAVRAGGAVLVGSRLAAQLNLQPGDRVDLMAVGTGKRGRPSATYPFTVAGVVPEDWDAPTVLWLSLADARARLSPPVPTEALVRLRPGADAAAVAAAIRAELPGVRVETRDQMWAAARRAHGEKLGLFLAVLYVLTVFAAVGVVQTAVMVALEQRREVALLRAAGATPRQAALTVLTQTALPGVLGGLLGAAGGALFGHQLVQLFAAWIGADLAGGLGNWYVPAAAVALAVLAALPAAMGAARQPAAAALRQL